MEEPNQYINGPYINFACLCDNIIQDNTGCISLIRIITKYTVTASGNNPPEDMPTQSIPLHMAIGLIPDEARGRNTIKIVPELPTGATLEPQLFPVNFDGEDRGVSIIFQINFPITLEGLYWFKVYLGDVQLTALPLRIIYQPFTTG